MLSPDRRAAFCLPACLLALLAGCTGLPPRPVAPALPDSAPLSGGAAEQQGTEPASWPQREWWRGFGDDTLNTLVARALAQSPDLAAATARMAAARALVEGAHADSRAQMSANASAAQIRLSDNGLFPPELLGFNWYSQFDAGINASYGFDWWGKHRAEIAAAVNSARAAEAERASAALGIASTVVAEYYGWQSDAARHELALQDRRAAEQRAQISAARVAAQIERSDSSHSAELALLTARDHLSELETALQRHQLALAALLACAPAQLPALSATALPQLRTGLPEHASLDLIARRPEIAASRWRVEAAARNLELARSNFLPDVSLKALAGFSSREIGRLLDAGSAAPQFSAALHLPLFDGGALRAGYAHQQALLDSAVALYRSAIVAAAREVNEQLAVRAQWERQEQLRTAQLAAADQLRGAAQQRAAAGLSDERPALEATQQWLSLGDAGIRTHYARLCAELALIRALGGGYQMDTKQ
jgi:multidrug efflux system outer membrane protein